MTLTGSLLTQVMKLRALNFENPPGFGKQTKPRSLYPEEEERGSKDELEQEVEEEEKFSSKEVETPEQEQASNDAQDVEGEGERGGEEGGGEQPAAKGLFVRGLAWLMGTDY